MLSEADEMQRESNIYGGVSGGERLGESLEA